MKGLNLLALTILAICIIVLKAHANPNASSLNSSTTDVNKLTIHVDIAGVAKKTHKEVMAKYLNHPDEPPSMNGEPEHLRLVFDDDKLHDYTDYLQRQLLIYPTQQYAQLFHGKDKVEFDRTISQLNKIIVAKSDKGAKVIPILPAADAYEVFHNQFQYLNFKQGSGVSFLSCYAQDEAPIKNGDFFYTFQGLTKDGKYYLSFFCPVEVKTLPKLASSKKGSEYLRKLPRAQFTPSLEALDRMIESISIE